MPEFSFSEFLSELEDGAAARFFKELEHDRFMTTRCKDCDYTFFPPRVLCPRCLGDGLEWVELSGEGSLYAYTQQHMAVAHIKPEVVGVVDLEDCEGRIFTLIEAPFEELEIGIPVRVVFFDSPLGLRLHKFVPVYE